MTLADDDFEELHALQAEMATRHRRLVGGLIAAGVFLLVAAAVSCALIDTERRPGLFILPLGLASFGTAVLGRGLYSAFTDVDTREREDEIVGLAPLDDKQDRP